MKKEKNKKAAIHNGQEVLNTNLLEIIAKPETLLLAYRAMKGNKGALTPGNSTGKKQNEKNDSRTK